MPRPTLFKSSQQELNQTEVPVRLGRVRIVRQGLSVAQDRLLRTTQSKQRVAEIVASLHVTRLAIEQIAVRFHGLFEALPLLCEQGQIIAPFERLWREPERPLVVIEGTLIAAKSLQK